MDKDATGTIETFPSHQSEVPYSVGTIDSPIKHMAIGLTAYGHPPIGAIGALAWATFSPGNHTPISRMYHYGITLESQQYAQIHHGPLTELMGASTIARRPLADTSRQVALREALVGLGKTIAEEKPATLWLYRQDFDTLRTHLGMDQSLPDGLFNGQKIADVTTLGIIYDSVAHPPILRDFDIEPDCSAVGDVAFIIRQVRGYYA